MSIVMQITLTEDGFAKFESAMLKLRAWLNSDPETKDGRGDCFAARIPGEEGEQEIFLAVRRDQEGGQ